jgi:hypothetical protein
MPGTLQQAAEAAGSIFGVRTAEEPKYEIIDRLANIEIRRYAPRIAAETTVEAKDGGKARSEAFSRLAGYIFGGNRDKRSIAMTAPVANEKGRQIAMTAPVEMDQPDDLLTMRFFLPSEITAENAPAPSDLRVRVVEVPEETIATLTFSGLWTGGQIKQKEAELLTGLKSSRWQATGRPFAQLYDPPFTIPFLRKNEAAIRVAKAA